MVREKLKGFSKDAALYGLGDTLGRLVGLVMFPILSRVFVPSDYGAIDLLTVSFAFAATLVQLEVPSGMQRFYFREEGRSRKILVTSCVVFLLAWSVVCAGLLALVAPQLGRLVPEESADVVFAIRLLAASLPLAVLWEQMALLLRLTRRAVAFSVVNIVKIAITPTLTAIAVVGLDLGIDGVFLAHLASYAVVAVLVTVLARRELCASVRFSEFMRALRFSLPGHPAAIIRQAMNILPRYVLAAFAPLTAVGLFGIAQRIGGVLRVLMIAFRRAWSPFAFANEGAADERRLYELATRSLIACLVIAAMALSVYARELLMVLAPPEYTPAALLVPGIALYFALDGLSAVYTTALYTRNAVRWTSYLSAVRVAVFLGAGVLLVPPFGAGGLVVAMVLSSVLFIAGHVIVVSRLFAFSLPWGRVAGLLGCAAGLLVVVTNLPWGLLAVLVCKTLSLLVTALLAFLLLFSAAERSILRSGAARLRGGAHILPSE